MISELTVHITEGFYGDGIKVFVVRRLAYDDHQILRNTADSGFTAWERLEPGADAEPTFVLNGEVGRAVTDALVRHYQGAEDMRSLHRDYDAALQRGDAQASVIADVVRTLARAQQTISRVGAFAAALDGVTLESADIAEITSELHAILYGTSPTSDNTPATPSGQVHRRLVVAIASTMAAWHFDPQLYDRLAVVVRKRIADILMESDGGTCGCGCACWRLVDPEFDCAVCHGAGVAGSWCSACGLKLPNLGLAAGPIEAIMNARPVVPRPRVSSDDGPATASKSLVIKVGESTVASDGLVQSATEQQVNAAPPVDECEPDCTNGHMYDGRCTQDPHLEGVTTTSREHGIRTGTWRCTADDGCGHISFGHTNEAAARRSYDRHRARECPRTDPFQEG